jgi:hypothetical protein
LSTSSLEAGRRNRYRNLSSWIRRSPWQACWPLQRRSPETRISESANPERHWLGETEAAQKELLHATLEPEETEAAQRTEKVRKLAKILKAGTEFQTLKEVQRFILVAREGVVCTLETMDQLNNEVKEFTEYDPGGD